MWSCLSHQVRRLSHSVGDVVKNDLKSNGLFIFRPSRVLEKQFHHSTHLIISSSPLYRMKCKQYYPGKKRQNLLDEFAHAFQVRRVTG